ncbi:MAG: hypothetical protein A4E29_01323 [Methanomassiliicoccales archaeon PtaB.Bin134]|nr:MAG: hypothetical protein A4E29_01323 [Methanomassiliicoccales archaeon PtaB.Bin134]
MRINPSVKNALIDYLEGNVGKFVSLQEIINRAPREATDQEILFILSEGEFEGNIRKDRKQGLDGYTIVKSMEKKEKLNDVVLVISKPELHKFGLEGVQARNNQIETRKCFCDIIDSSKHFLRICSPFMERNVSAPDSIPDFGQRIANALKRGVQIKLLSRELALRRGNEVDWMIDIAESVGEKKSLEIRDYHFLNQTGTKIHSSTHAKMLIADHSMAYVGSGELREYSLAVNFEVGCQLKGPIVVGAVEIFDSMFQRGVPYDR